MDDLLFIDEQLHDDRGARLSAHPVTVRSTRRERWRFQSRGCHRTAPVFLLAHQHIVAAQLRIRHRPDRSFWGPMVLQPFQDGFRAPDGRPESGCGASRWHLFEAFDHHLPVARGMPARTRGHVRAHGCRPLRHAELRRFLRL